MELCRNRQDRIRIHKKAHPNDGHSGMARVFPNVTRHFWFFQHPSADQPQHSQRPEIANRIGPAIGSFSNSYIIVVNFF